MSVLYVGAYSWSYGAGGSSSTCEATTAIGVSVHVSGSMCHNCSAMTTTSGGWSRGSNSYGGSLSVFYIGAYSWSYSQKRFFSSSTCGETSASASSIDVSNSSCFTCSAVTMTTTSGGKFSDGANSYGGSMSVLYVGAYSWSYSEGVSSNSTCGGTSADGVSIHVSDFKCLNCSAMTTTSGQSITGTNSNLYGGSMSAAYFGASAFSLSSGSYDLFSVCVSLAQNTHVTNLMIAIQNATIADTTAMSRKYCFTSEFKDRFSDVFCFLRSVTGFTWSQRESCCSESLSTFLQLANTAWRVTFRRFMAAQSV
jgi:hypothetical protein